jgi:hypothetical protein
MSFRKNGLKALGLSFLAVLGLMAFMAAGASANWLVEGKELHVTEEVAVKTHVEGNLLVPAQKLEIKCTIVEGKDLLLQALSTLASGKVAFKGCVTTQNGKLAPNCDPINQPITAGGTAHLILHNGAEYVLFKPVGGLFTTVEFDPAKCALVEDSEVTGTLVAECLTEALGAGNCLNEEVAHLLRAHANQALFGAGLFFGENSATLDGIAATALAGKAAKWSGHI